MQIDKVIDILKKLRGVALMTASECSIPNLKKEYQAKVLAYQQAIDLINKEIYNDEQQKLQEATENDCELD